MSCEFRIEKKSAILSLHIQKLELNLVPSNV